MIGLSSYAFRWAFGFGPFKPTRVMEPEALVDIASAAGLDVVQLCDNVPLLRYDDHRLRLLRAHAEAAGVGVELGVRGTEPSTLKRAVSAAEVTSARLLRVVVEVERDGDVDAQLARASEALRHAAQEASRSGIVVAVENHATTTADELLRLLRMVDHEGCGACVDTMNSVLLLESPADTVRKLAPRAFSVHLKDFVFRKEPDSYLVVGTALGDGQLDLEAVVDLVGLDAPVRSWHAELYLPRSGDEAETLAAEAAAVSRSIRRLRELFQRG